jgi:hypothetical protein
MKFESRRASAPAGQEDAQLCATCRFAELLGAGPCARCTARGTEHAGLVMAAMQPACRDFVARSLDDAVIAALLAASDGDAAAAVVTPR